MSEDYVIIAIAVILVAMKSIIELPFIILVNTFNTDHRSFLFYLIYNFMFDDSYLYYYYDVEHMLALNEIDFGYINWYKASVTPIHVLSEIVLALIFNFSFFYVIFSVFSFWASLLFWLRLSYRNNFYLIKFIFYICLVLNLFLIGQFGLLDSLLWVYFIFPKIIAFIYNNVLLLFTIKILNLNSFFNLIIKFCTVGCLVFFISTALAIYLAMLFSEFFSGKNNKFIIICNRYFSKKFFKILLFSKRLYIIYLFEFSFIIFLISIFFFLQFDYLSFDFFCIFFFTISICLYIFTRIRFFIMHRVHIVIFFKYFFIFLFISSLIFFIYFFLFLFNVW